jgi:arginine/lysine/ornithine decarboxylase
MSAEEALLGQLYGGTARITTSGASNANHCGIAALLRGMKGRLWVVQWNCHTSVLAGLRLMGVKKVLRLLPQFHPTLGFAMTVTPEEFATQTQWALDQGYKLGPFIANGSNYEGDGTDPILVKMAHDLGMPVLGDDSWMSYMQMSRNPLATTLFMAGAEYATYSWHKTTGKMAAQGAVIVRNPDSSLTNEWSFEDACLTLSTTSEAVPLWTLMALTRYHLAHNAPDEIDSMMRTIDEAVAPLKDRGLYRDVQEEMRQGWTATRGWNKGQVVVLPPPGYTGFEIHKLLLDGGIEINGQLVEEGWKTKGNMMYLVLVTGLGPASERTLRDTVGAIVALYDKLPRREALPSPLMPPLKNRFLDMSDAMTAKTKVVDISEIAGYKVYNSGGMYPPGFEAFAHGDVPEQDMVDYIQWGIDNGAELHGLATNRGVAVSLRRPRRRK